MSENTVSSSGSPQSSIATLPLRGRVWRLLSMGVVAVTLVFAMLLTLDKRSLVYALITPPHTPDATIEGAAFGGSFGFSVSSAGDINNDGFGDVIVGADEENKIYTYKGSSSGLTTTVYFDDAGLPGGKLGWSVDGGDDVSGDNIDDFIAGAPIITGVAYVYNGSSVALPTRSATLSDTVGDEFGWSVAIIGDVDNDGIADVAVGAPSYGISNAGRVYIYYGPVSGNDTAETMLDGEAANDGFGVSVSSAGDVNGDGIDDLVVGAWKFGAVGSEQGRAYVFYGSNTGVSFSNKSFVTGNNNDKLGTSVHGAGDVNGDGYDDIIAGADTENPSTTTVGRAVVYPGGPSGLISTPLYTALGQSDDDRFGFAVAGNGDLDGDGFSDFGAGAYNFDAPATDSGKGYGACTNGTIAPSLSFSNTGDDASDNYGRSIAIVQDVNGDSLDDLVVGAYAANNPAPVGKVYAYYGAVGGCRPAVALTKTVSLANFPALFTNTSVITVPTGTVVRYTFAVRNTGNVTLTQHTVVDNKLGTVAALANQSLPPGAIYTATITATLNVSTSNVATWTSAIPINSPSGQTIPANRTLSALANAAATVQVSGPTSDLDGDGVPDNEEGSVDEDGDGIPAYLDPDETPTPEGDVPIEGLSITGPSTLLLGEATKFDALITAGTNVSYTWDFGDTQAFGISQSNQTITHTFEAPGSYVIGVTAINSANQVSTTKSIVVNYPVRLPLIMTVGMSEQ